MKRPTNSDGIRKREFIEREGWDEELPALMQAFDIDEPYEGALAAAIENAIVDGLDVTGIMIDLDKREVPERRKRLRAKAARIEVAVRAASNLAFDDADDPGRLAVEKALAVIVEQLGAVHLKPRRDDMNAPLTEAAIHLVRFWKETLKRPFHSNHTKWVRTPLDGPPKGPKRGDRFVWEALKLAGLAPNHLVGLRTILRDFGEPRPRLRKSSP